MTIMQARLVSHPATRRRQAQAALLAAAIVAVATALLELLAPSATSSTLTTAAAYAFTVMLFPFVLAPAIAVALLHQVNDGSDGRLGTAGSWVAYAGFIGFVPCGIASLITANGQALGPLYILSILASLAGLAVFAVAVFRARVLPRWAGPLLPVAWLLGGPLGAEFRGAPLILAAAFTAIALTLPPGPAPER